MVVGNAVLAPGGLVGTAARVADDSASVLLVTDPQSTVGVRVKASGEMGIEDGQDLDCRSSTLPRRLRSVTTGRESGSTQRAGVLDLPVGTISGLATRRPWTRALSCGDAGGGMTTLDTFVDPHGRS